MKEKAEKTKREQEFADKIISELQAAGSYRIKVCRKGIHCTPESICTGAEKSEKGKGCNGKPCRRVR